MMQAIPLRQYIDDVYKGNVKAFAAARGVGSRIVYRDLQQKVDSMFILYVGGSPRLIEVKADLPSLPASLSCDNSHKYPVSFDYDGLRYFVTRSLTGTDQISYSLNTIGDEPPTLRLEHEVHTKTGFVRFSFFTLSRTSAFELLVNEFGHWVNSDVLCYQIVSKEAGTSVEKYWSSFDEAYRHCLAINGAIYFGDALVYHS